MTRQQNLWHHMTWPGREEVMVEPTTAFSGYYGYNSCQNHAR